MKFHCKRERFFQLFSLASSVTSIRDIKAVLQNICCVVSENYIRLLATDTELSLRLELSEDIQVEEAGETIFPARVFKRILQENQDLELAIESNDEKMLVYGEHSKYQLPTQLASDFPDIPPFSAMAFHTISAKVLRELIHRTAFATDAENTKYTLSGVLFEFTNEKITAVATDGKRLAYQFADAKVTGDHFSENTSIFPLKALNLIDKAIKDDEEVDIALMENRGAIRAGATTIYCQLIEGRFPRWRNIIPETEGRVQVDILVSALLSAVRQAEIVTPEKESGVYLSFSEGNLEIRASGAEIGESQINIPISYSSEEPILIRLDARFVIEFLRNIEPEKIVSLYLKKDAPVLFKMDDDYSYVVMPLNI